MGWLDRFRTRAGRGPSSEAPRPLSQADKDAARERTMELLREVRRIEIQTSRLVDQHLAGSYQSMFKGQGVAFADIRAYEPGDDVRTIDWNVTARTGEPHVKLFSEERELTVMLIVDMSGSLDLGSTEADKRKVVARLVATFAFSAIRNNDRVGLIGFTDEVEVFVPPRSGRKHVLSVITQVLSHEPKSRRTDAAQALRYMARLRRRSAVVVLVSDFIDVDSAPAAKADAGRAQNGEFERALKMVRRRNEVIPVRVEDPIELELPPLGLVAVEDLEAVQDSLGLSEENTERSQVLGSGFIDLGTARTRAYKAQVDQERASFDAMMRRMSLEAITVRCGDHWQSALVHFFKRRARRMR